MGLFNWFRRYSDKEATLKHAASRTVTGVVDYSQSDTLFLNAEMDNRNLLLIGNKRTFPSSGIILSTFLTLGRQCGWRGGQDFFDDSSEHAILRQICSGMKVSDSDALSLALVLRAAITRPNDDAAKIALEFIDFCSEGGFSIIFAQD